MAKRIVTNQKTGQQGVFDDSTGELTPLSKSQRVVTHTSGAKGIFDESTGDLTPIDSMSKSSSSAVPELLKANPTKAPEPTTPEQPAQVFEEPKKKDATASAGARTSLAGSRKVYGDLNTASTDNGELSLQIGSVALRGGNPMTLGSSASTHTAEQQVAEGIKHAVLHPIDTAGAVGRFIAGGAKGAWDFGVEAFGGLSKFAQASGSAGVGAPSQFIAAHEKGITATGEKTYKQRLETSEQIQKETLDKVKFGAPEGKSAQIVTYDKKTNEMGMRAPDAEAFGYEAGKGIAQIASMAFGGELGVGLSFFSSLENNYNEARKEGIPADRAFGESAIRAGAETASDKYIGISSMIEKAMAKGVGKAAINQLLTGEITKEAFAKLVAGQGMNLSKEGLKNIGKGFIAEGGEEFAQEYMDEGIKKLFNYYQTKKNENDPNAKVEMYETKDIFSKELLTGALNSGVYGGIIGSMGGVFLNSKDFHPTVYSSLQNAYDDSGIDGLARAKQNIIKGVDKAITDKKYGAEQRETVLANLDLMEKNITSFQQKSGVDELTRYQKFDLENYSIPNNTASLSTYLATALNDDVVPNQGDVDKDIEDGLVQEIPFNNILNVPDAFLPYVEKSKVFQGEGDLSVVAKVPNTVKAVYDQNQQTRNEFGQAVNEAMNKVLGNSTSASYESVLYAGRQLFQDKSKQDAFEMELAQHEPIIKKRIEWSNYLYGLKKNVEKTGQPFDINARNQALKNINNFSEGQRVMHNGTENTIESISPDGQKARMANYEGEVNISDLQKIEAPTEIPAPAAVEGEVPVAETPVEQPAPKKAPIDASLTPIVSVVNDGKTYEHGGQIGVFSQDEQGRMKFETPTKIIDLGNVNDPDYNQKTLKDFGFQAAPTNITVNDNGTIEIDGRKFTNKSINPIKAITYDKNGQAISIRLYNEKGEVRTIRGISAQTIDYKYKLKDFGNTATDTEIQSAIDEATAAVETQQSTGETTIATEDKPVEQAQQVEEQPTSDRVETLVEKIKASTGKMITAIDAAINAATNSLRDAGITVEMFDTTAEFNAAVGVTGNKIPQGIFLSESGKIFLNREAMQAGWETTVVWHEATHPIINIIRNTDRKLYDSVVSGILKLAETNPQFKAVSEFVNKEYTSEESIPDEILVESIARIASGKIVFNTLPTTLKEKLIDLVNKMAKALGMKENLISVSNEKAFKDLAGKIVQTLKQGESLAKVVGAENIRNFQLDQPSGMVDENGNDLTNRQMQFSLQNNYTDSETGFTYYYVKDTQEFNDLKNSGNITDDKFLSNFNGDHIFLHQPDAAFSGKILKNGQLLVKGSGGIFYPINFHKDGYFWASTSKAAKGMAMQLNENARLNNGRVLMALTSAPSDKLFSSTTMASAVLDLFRSKVVDDTFGLDKNTVRLAILDALKTEVLQKLPNGKTKLIYLKQGEKKLYDIIPPDASLDEIVGLIKQSLAPDQSIFIERSTFIELTLDRIAKAIKGTDAEQKLGEFFHKGIDNKYFKGYKGGKYNLKKATLSQSISYMLSEPLLRTEEKLGEPLGGKVYAMLEMQVKGYKENHAKELSTTTFGNSAGSGKTFSYNRMFGKIEKKKNGDIYFVKGTKATDRFKLGNESEIENKLTKDLGVFPLTDAVKSIPTTSHESYPESIAKFDNESNIILHILQDRQMWSDHFQDFATKKIVEYKRKQSVYPSTGVSSGSLVLDVQKGQMSQGNRNIEPQKQEKLADTLLNVSSTTRALEAESNNNTKGYGKITAINIIDKAKEISDKNEYLNCDSFCSKLVNNKSFKSEFDVIPFKFTSKNNKVGQLEDGLIEGDIIAFGEKGNVRHYATYIGNGKVIEVEEWGAKPREHSLEENLKDYENVANIYRDKQGTNASELSQKYHTSKNDGINPEFVKSVESLLNKSNPQKVQFSQGNRDAEAYDFAKNFSEAYTDEELSEALQKGLGYSKEAADAIVSEALRNPSTPSLSMVYDSKMMDNNAPMNQELGLKNDIIQGSRESVDKHLQEQEQKDKVTVAGIMEALVDDKWDIRKAIEKYSGKKGFTSALLRTISGINAAIDLRLKKSMDEIYNGLNAIGEANLDRLIFSYRVIQLFEKQNRKRNKYYGDTKRKAVDDFFKENKRVPTSKELDIISDKLFKEAEQKFPTMSHGVTTWDGKPDTVVTVQMAYDTVAEMEKKLGAAEVGGFKDLERRAMAYKRFANESLKDAHRAGMISDEVYEDYKDDFYSYRVTVDRLFESMSNEDQQINRRTMEKAFGTLSKTGTQNAIMTNSRISMGLSYAMMHKAIKRNELKKSIYDDTVAKGLGGDLFKPANFLISKKTGQILTDEKGDQVGSADSGFTHIGIKVDGRNTYYQMKTSLFNQMEGLNKTFENPSVAEKFLQGLGNQSNRFLTAFATRYNPLFFDSNIPMDLGQQIIFTDIWDKGKTYTSLIGSSFRAIARTAQFVDPLGRNKEKIQEVMEDWIAFGGSQDLMSLSKEMKSEFTSEGSVTLHGDPKKKGSWRKFKDGVSYFNTKTEVAMRLAAFNEVRNNMLEDYAKENGKQKPSENEMYKINTIAAAQSRAYTDFAQKGTYLPKWNMAYLNSSVQAFAATLEYAVDNPKALAFKFAQMGAAGFSFQLGIMSAMALFGAGGMDDVTEYEKDRNILIPLFFTVGKDKFGNPKNIWHFKKIRVNPTIVPFWIAIRKSAELAFNSINGIEKKPLTAGQMIDGTIDAMNEALPLAIPMVGFAEPKMTQRIGQLLSRKLMISAIYKAEFGVDVYRDRDLRSYDDIQGVLSAEGIDNKNVPYIYKAIGKTVGLSPLRTQAFTETFITSPTTNILTGIAYSASSDLANAIIPAATETERGEYRFFDKAGIPNLDKIGTALGKKSFTKSNPDLQYNTEMNDKYKMQAQLLKEANTNDRLMKIDLEEIKSQSANSDEFFQKATSQYVPSIDENNIEKRMSAYKMIEQIMTKGTKKEIFSEKSYMDAIILKNSGDATGRAKMMQYMYGDNLETAQEMITYSSTLGLSAEDVYFALEEYKKLIKK